MTKAGIKTEDYRDINEYWFRRIFRNVDNECLNEMINGLKEGWCIEKLGNDYLHYPKEFTQNTTTLGYPKKDDKERILKLEHKGIMIGYGNPEWGAEPNKLYFIIKHGNIINQP